MVDRTFDFDCLCHLWQAAGNDEVIITPEPKYAKHPKPEIVTPFAKTQLAAAKRAENQKKKILDT